MMRGLAVAGCSHRRGLLPTEADDERLGGLVGEVERDVAAFLQGLYCHDRNFEVTNANLKISVLTMFERREWFCRRRLFG